MKREDLTAKGLTPEQVKFVMVEYGKEYNPLVAERDSYKTLKSSRCEQTHSSMSF